MLLIKNGTNLFLSLEAILSKKVHCIFFICLINFIITQKVTPFCLQICYIIFFFLFVENSRNKLVISALSFLTGKKYFSFFRLSFLFYIKNQQHHFSIVKLVFIYCDAFFWLLQKILHFPFPITKKSKRKRKRFYIPLLF